jgi:hypothetical protein
MYIPPAVALNKALVMDDNREVVIISKKLFFVFFRAAFEEMFDARWYRATYPDVAAAVDKGEIGSELDHFIEGGYWEGRMPCSVAVNEEWYKLHYSDVSAAIEAGEIASAHQHYNKTGYFEGRVPDSSAELAMAKWNHALAQASPQ